MQLPAYRWRFVHLAALWGYGVSQPVFSMLKGNPEFLVVRGSTRADVVMFAVALAFVPPLVVLAVEAVTSLASATLSGALHVVAVWAFAFVAVLQLTRLLDVERGSALLLPMVPAMVVALLYMKVGAFRTFLSLSFVLPLVGVAGFVATVPLATDDAPAADVRVANPVPVVLVAFDEFPVSSIMRPDGSIDAVRYPNFDRLAREATWYSHATSVNEGTTQAVPAILTGIEPRHGELPTLADHPDNLFTLLGRRYALHASEQVTRLCPSRYCPATGERPPVADRQRGLFYDVAVGYMHRVLPAALAGELPPIGERWGGFGGSDVRDRVIGALDTDAWLRIAAETRGQKQGQFARFLKSLRSPLPNRGALFFEHALLPHSPWRFLPSGRAYPDADDVAGISEDWTRWRSSPQLVATALQRHLLQVGYTDRLLGVLIRRLQAVGLFDRALVIVTADHGASFEPNGLMRQVVPANLPDIAGVPLFVKYPGQRKGRIDNRAAKTIDIVPTIADVLGVRIPWHVTGVSLRSAPVRRPVEVSKTQGDPVVGSPAAVEAGVLVTARRNAALFGVGRHTMYRIAPYPQVLGTSPRTAATAGSDRDDARFDDPMLFSNVRLSSGFVPARIAGAISGGVGDGTSLAIAVNGRVRATTRAYDLDGQTRFEALVPETSFHDGRNDVEVYAISRSNGAFRLVRLGGTTRGGGALITATATSEGHASP